MPLASNCDSVSRNAEIGRKIHAGPRLHLPLERIAVQVDDARQHQQPGRIEATARQPKPPIRSIRPSCEQQIRLHQSIRRQQHRPAGDMQDPCNDLHGSKTICTRGVG